jgi:hypothetical protein
LHYVCSWAIQSDTHNPLLSLLFGLHELQRIQFVHSMCGWAVQEFIDD